MVCMNVGVEHCKHPTWSRVGMEITPDELKKVLESKDDKASILDTMPDLGCILLALVVATLVVYFIYRRFIRRRINQGQWESVHWRTDQQKLRQTFELQEQVLLKVECMEHMEQRIVAMEDFLRCMWRRRSMVDKRNQDSDFDRKEAPIFSDCSD